MPHWTPPARRPRRASRTRRGTGLVVAWVLAVGGGYLVEATATHGLPWIRAARAPYSRVLVVHLHRPGLRRPSEVWMYRPAVPESARLPILYFLHGQPGEAVDIFHAGLKQVIDRYIAQGGTPFVIAAPDGNSSLHKDTEWGDASDGSDAVESFLLKTVIPAVETRFPRSAARRAIAGFSMGGYGAMNIGLRHRELFGQIVSIAGYFQLDDPSHMFATAESRLANAPTANVAQARGRRVLLLEDRDDPHALIRGQTLRFKTALQQVGANVVWHLGSGGHDLRYVIGQMRIVARVLARGFGTPAGA